MILSFKYEELRLHAIREHVEEKMKTIPRGRCVETLRFQGFKRSTIASVMSEIQKFGGLPSLRRLEVDRHFPSEDGDDSTDFGPFVKMPTSLALLIDVPRIPDAMRAGLKELAIIMVPGVASLIRACPLLEHVTVTLPLFSDYISREGFRGCRHIRSLTVQGHEMEWAMNGLLRNLTGLRKLEVRCKCILTARQLETFVRSVLAHENLEELSFWNLRVRGADESAFYHVIEPWLGKLQFRIRYTLSQAPFLREYMGLYTCGDLSGVGPATGVTGADPMAIYGCNPMICALFPLLGDLPLVSFEYVHLEDPELYDHYVHPDLNDPYADATELPDERTMKNIQYSPRIQDLLLKRLPDLAERGLSDIRVHTMDGFSTERLGAVFESIARVRTLKKVEIFYHGDSTGSMFHLSKIVQKYLFDKRTVHEFRAVQMDGMIVRPIPEIQNEYDASLELSGKLHAFASGSHTRLGYQSPLTLVPADIMRRIGSMMDRSSQN
jgi:hypothetical protein